MIDPTTEALYITSVREVMWGTGLVATTMVMHGVGMIFTQLFSNEFKQKVGRRFGEQRTFVSGMSSLVLASWMIVLVHSIEVLMWAGFFQWKHSFPNFSTAVYFSFLEYTTVGSAFNLPLNWRLLEGMIATAGLLAFAWSTGVLLTLATSFQEQQLRLLRERREKSQRKAPPQRAGKT